jgi:hypothetical protein
VGHPVGLLPSEREKFKIARTKSIKIYSKNTWISAN